MCAYNSNKLNGVMKPIIRLLEKGEKVAYLGKTEKCCGTNLRLANRDRKTEDCGRRTTVYVNGEFVWGLL
jgi:Fe-S oxidoreductase